jgi:YbbR domain-containing protein
MAIIKLSATERRRVSAFLTCLVLAFFAWIFTILSNPYSYTVKGLLAFKNAPQKRAFHSLQADSVKVIVNGNGWDMLFAKMNLQNKQITVDLKTLENKSYIVLSSQLEQINIKKEISQQITGFNPDTLYFDFSNRKEKRVPVELVSALHFQHQFSQSGNPIIKPAYVIINGPSDIIDKISVWKTDSLKLDSIGETVHTSLMLQHVTEGNVSIYPKSVLVTLPVDEFTEKTLLIPVKLINNNNYYDVKVFPLKVKVTFTTSLKKYAEINEDYFEATADLDLWRQHGYKALPVLLSKVPQYCKIVKVEPANIDFIIKK